MTTLTEFHLFPFLPWEMRNRIWELAIRPLDRSGAHFFDVDYVVLDEERRGADVDYRQWLDNYIPFYGKQHKKDKQDCRLALKEGDIWVLPIHGEYYDYRTYGLLSARVPATTLSTPGVAAGNPSVYMVDGGLWTACKHSREVMMRAFESDKWDKLRMKHKQFQGEIEHKYWGYSPVFGEGYPYAGLSREGIAKMPSTFYTSSSLPSSSLLSSSSTSTGTSSSTSCSTTTGPTTNPKEDNRNDVSATTILGKRYFTVLPHQDLFIFRPSTRLVTSGPQVEELLWKNLVEKFPLCAQANGFLGFTNFAIEFNPTWGDSDTYRYGCPQVEHMTEATEALGALHQFGKNGLDEEDCVLWLIDYRLIPKPKAGTAHTITTTTIVPDGVNWDYYRPSEAFSARTRKLYSQRIFHDGNGGRYVPVEVWGDWEGDIVLSYASEEYVYPEGSLKPTTWAERSGTAYLWKDTDSCRDIINRALQQSWADKYPQNMEPGTPEDWTEPQPRPAQWGVLAYLPPGTEEGTGIHTS